MALTFRDFWYIVVGAVVIAFFIFAIKHPDIASNWVMSILIDIGKSFHALKG